MKILDRIQEPGDLKDLSLEEMRELAREIRREIISTVAVNGGHLASSLGVVELTLAWHAVFDSPTDRIIWDVGHQSYAHKIITGRKDRFCTIRQLDGLSGFPKRSESCHDPFDTGHSGTSISAAVGLAEAARISGDPGRITAVIGDGAMTGGMAFEAINHAGHLKTDMLVILNDNEMSIDDNVGALSAYLDRIRTGSMYMRTKNRVKFLLGRVPVLGPVAVRAAEKLKAGFKYLFIPGILFEELGFTYLGPVDGHDLASLMDHLRRAGTRPGPVLLHVITEKGKGYSFAEKSPEVFHGVGEFNISSGVPVVKPGRTYTRAFSDILVQLAGEDPRVCAITAAMARGTGLEAFRQKYPERFFDVGIAEQHAVTLAAGLSAGGMVPVVAIYATFMQRAADQLIHDVCMQNLPVVFCVDRAGLVGADGETHQGIFDLGMFRGIPNLEILMPSDETSLRDMLVYALNRGGPVMIRYPRDYIEDTIGEIRQRMGSLTLLREGADVCLLGAGNGLNRCLEAAALLKEQGLEARVADLGMVSPPDRESLRELARRYPVLYVVEENASTGGVGTAVMEAVDCLCRVVRISLPDRFIEHGSQKELRSRYGLDARSISGRVIQDQGNMSTGSPR